MADIRKILCVFASAAVIGTSSLPFADTFTGGFGIVASAAKTDSPSVKCSIRGNSVTLSWSAVDGADGYRVYEYDSGAKKYIKLKTVASLRTTIKDVSEGKHYYKVAAVTKSAKGYTAGAASEKITVTVGGESSASAAQSSKKPSEKITESVQLAAKMGNGWNLGNTMESRATWLGSNAKAKDYENAWGQPTTRKEMMSALKKAGFDSVRIPVAWSNMMSEDGKYTISQSYFDRVDEIVGYVLDNDMYCIINIHWDGGWWEDFGSEDESVRNAAMDKYRAMWKQISAHYASCSDRLIFESANEELGSSTRGKSSLAESYARVNEINQTFVDTVRAGGGKNKDRFLLIAGYDTGISSTCSKLFEMPSDKVKDRLLISVHYYTPSTFCIADNKKNSWGYKGSWGTDADKNEMRNEFEKMKKFTDKGYGVIIGEYGVAHEKNGSSYKVKDGTDLFFRSVRELADEYGYCAMLWDCNDWFDRNSCTFRDSSYAEIYKR